MTIWKLLIIFEKFKRKIHTILFISKIFTMQAPKPTHLIMLPFIFLGGWYLINEKIWL